MKRIVFLLKEKVNKWDYAWLIFGMILKGVRVLFKDSLDEECRNDTLYVTDNKGMYDALMCKGNEPLVCVYKESDMDIFPGARFFVMAPNETEKTYCENVYKRIHDIPWEVIKTRRLILRETTEEDVDAFYEIYKDPRMTEYMENLYEDPKEEKRYAREYRDKVYYVQGFGIWSVVRKKDNRVIGRAGLTAREGFLEYEVGFAIGCDYQRKGYGQEAVLAILKYAKENDLGKINALVRPQNVASIKLLEKIGFKKTSETQLSGVTHDVWSI